MRGNLLESYCALAKADCYLELEKIESNERKVDNLCLELERSERRKCKIDDLREKIHYVQREIYNLGGEE